MLSYCDYLKDIISLPDGLCLTGKQDKNSRLAYQKIAAPVMLMYFIGVPRKHQQFPKVTPTFISVPEHVDLKFCIIENR